MFQIQRVATEVIGQVLAGRNLTEALSEALQHESELTPQQRGGIRDLCYGTLRHYGTLDAVLKQMMTRTPEDPRVRLVLLVALYQLQHTSAAPYAIVDHAVRQVARWLPPAKGMANAILRRFQRERRALLDQAGHDPASRYALPGWWVNELRHSYPTSWKQIAEAGLLHPPMGLRVNLRKQTVAAYQQRLHDEGLSASPVGEAGLLLQTPVPVHRLPGFAEGEVSVQDLGAQQAATLLDAQDGMRVLDACAAPGGKTGHLLERHRLQLTALDVDAARLQRVKDNLDRLGEQATLLCGDASQPATWWDGQPFDRILLDVPCSASGVARRNPDIKLHRRPADIEQFARQQAALLDAIWPCLAVGGELLYATCSVFRAENQQQVAGFLQRQPQTMLIPLGDDVATLQLLPDAQQDGFYYARVRKLA